MYCLFYHNSTGLQAIFQYFKGRMVSSIKIYKHTHQNEQDWKFPAKNLLTYDLMLKKKRRKKGGGGGVGGKLIHDQDLNWGPQHL